MSAGAFVRSRYQASYGTGDQVHPIRVQPETLALTVGGDANGAPSDSITNPISALCSIGKRARGLSPRSVTIQFPATGQPTGYKAGGITRVPILTEGIYGSITVGGEVTYLGVTCEVISKSPESAD